MLNGSKGRYNEENRLLDLIHNVPPSIDADDILSKWKVVSAWFDISQHALPRPIWMQRDYEHSGKQAWEYISHRIPHTKETSAISIYTHVPFCERRCGFCDLYAIPLSKKKGSAESAFTKALLEEIAVWAGLGFVGNRPVTTVHFGGGTPNYLDPSYLQRIIDACRSSFSITSRTELALESTPRLMTTQHLVELKALGFTRIHVGVQTLDDRIRQRIGRCLNGQVVLERLKKAIDQGFIVSVDIVYGLPGQTLTELIATLDALINIGVHGFSLYQLQITSKNRKFLQRQGLAHPDPLIHFLFFHAGEQRLKAKGYHKNFFNHFALPQDKCLYYRHVIREEDLLALGPTADGVFGNYIYRHPNYKEYMRLSAPFLEGGMFETASETSMRPASAALMAATISRSMLQRLGADPLLELWLACEMLEPSDFPGYFNLTTNGSRLISVMLEQLKETVQQ